MKASKTQIDRLGERLKKGNISDDDLRLLDVYRRSFSEAYEFVVGAIKNDLGLAPTGRPAKSTTSIADKLRRESIRLTQIQDIAGCRLIVSDINNQETTVQSLSNIFEHTTVVDRRDKPSHGYRAVHVIVNYGGQMIEIQVRTLLQHLWAELSEKYSDVVNPKIKYGRGDKAIQAFLTKASFTVGVAEAIETRLANAQTSNLTDKETADIQEKLSSLRQAMFKRYGDTIEKLEKLKGEIDALSD